jgi:hypothetical protein
LRPRCAARGGRRSTDCRKADAAQRARAFQHSLIVVETTLAVALLTGGGLLLQTFRHLRNTDLGLRSEKLLIMETPLFRYGDFEKRVAFVNSELEKIRAIPGVVNAAATSRLPLRINDGFATFCLLEGQTKEQMPGHVALMRVLTQDYFATIGARLREARFIRDVRPPWGNAGGGRQRDFCRSPLSRGIPNGRAVQV